MDHDETPAAWDQINGEPHDAYQAFQYYRECGPTRNMAATGRAARASYAKIHEWATIWFWKDRVDDFDRAQARARDVEYSRIAKDAHERWAQQQALINDLSAEITIAELRSLQGKPGGLTPAELARFMRETSQQGNLAAGKPTKRVDFSMDLSKLDPETRKALEDLRPALEALAKGSE